MKVYGEIKLILVVGIGKSGNKKKERGKEFFMMITAVLRSQKQRKKAEVLKILSKTSLL